MKNLMCDISDSTTAVGGTRSYKLYLPQRKLQAKPPLIVMLHGCTQAPDDFARGTQMNQRAEDLGCAVLYPEQSRSANMNLCWNWFLGSHQKRDAGEPSILAAMTWEVLKRHGLDESSVFVAGLSAGGAMAAVLAQLYPELYVASGIHSGLPYGAATDMLGAFRAMSSGAVPTLHSRAVPTIVFHGDHDTLVNPANGDQLVDQMTRGLRAKASHGKAPQGRGYTRIDYATPAGRILVEQWTMHGAGHAWSGGSPAGTYTDPLGPNASHEMTRFFSSLTRAGKACT